MTRTTNEPSSVPIMRTVLRYSVYLVAAIALIGGIVGWFVAEWSGVASAIIAAGVALMFSAVTALSIMFAARVDAGMFMAVVLGAWILKLIAFLAILAIVKQLGFTHDWMLWGTMVAAMIGQLAIDVIVVLRARHGYVSDVELPRSGATSDEYDQ